ncbi:protease modulator HflC [Croceicoccus naphthovorans]|uniref:Protein HflC n=1 Tax=Croceicoccus naphthovorans TaxID=1348774 RepID=A0A0G3XBN6_9SPHN|nr:protease modulator HflC [Croceicoccus naphthovorans]AKM08985.1 membrane protease subunit HflC [Croceicoccus naphthovorans]MBB3989206.1 membrane protease subunit HflC [Croceicoccus naphthovorans]
MESIWQNHKGVVIGLAIAIVAVLSSIFVTPETKQAVIVRNGKPIDVVNKFRPDLDYGNTGAGVWYRVPLIDRVVFVSRQILAVDMQRQEVLSRDQRRLEVDAYARYRVIDPTRLVQTAGSTARVEEQLRPILNSVLRQRLGTRSFQALLTAERGAAMNEIKEGLDKEAREYGVQVIDVRIKRADLPAGRPLETAYTRMETARKQESDTIRAQGSKAAQIIRAEAEAEAAQTYAAAFNKDPNFYDFYRAMQSYDTVFSNDSDNSSIVLSPDNEYLRQFRGTGR